jgi:hypothetical protein
VQWEVCEGPDLATAWEEIKIVKRGKWLKETHSLWEHLNGEVGCMEVNLNFGKKGVFSICSCVLVVQDLLLSVSPNLLCSCVFNCMFWEESTTTCLAIRGNK